MFDSVVSGKDPNPRGCSFVMDNFERGVASTIVLVAIETSWRLRDL